MPALAASKTDTADLIAFLARSAEWTPSVDRQLAPIAPGSITWNDVAQPRAGDWPGYNGVPGGNRYSELAHITTTNVRNLAPRWSFPVSGGRSLETTPVVVDGVMYVTAVNTVYALDAAAGRQIWTWSRTALEGTCGRCIGRHQSWRRCPRRPSVPRHGQRSPCRAPPSYRADSCGMSKWRTPSSITARHPPRSS